MVGSLLERHGRVGIVAHDAGAANHLLAWIEPWMLPRIVPVIAGPARALWERRFPGAPTAGLDDLVTCGAVVTGSGWASDLEHAALRRARERGTLSVAVIDHWVNYRVRFVRAGVLALPDAIWVTDEDALAVARREIPEVPCHLQPNLHLAEQLRRLRPAGEVDGDRLLYVAEPIRVDWGLAAPGEFAALDFFARSLPALRLPPGTEIRLRPHPSEPGGKYDAWIARHAELGFRPDPHDDVVASLSEARWVAGCESSVMALGLWAGRRVFCTLPPGAPPSRLPQAGLIHLRDAREAHG